VFKQATARWQPVGPLSHFNDSNYVPAVITIEPGAGEAGTSIAYVCRHNLEIDGPIKDRYDHVIAISNGSPPRLRRSRRAGGQELRVPVPRWRLRLPRSSRGWSSVPAA
jgi:hypothetical protein